MISTIQNLYAGNALRLYLEPPTDAVAWRILRKGSDSFTDENDASAVVVYEGDDRVVVDAESLTNDQMAFYRPFYFNGLTWMSGPTNSGTPTAAYEDHSTDVLEFVRDRLERSLLTEVQRGNLTNELGYIQVYTAPPSLERDLRFPLVTIHLDSEGRGESGIGEDISGDLYDEFDGSVDQDEGWLANVQLSIIGWSLNSDERIQLRKALRRIVIANLPVFDSRGMIEIDLHQQDVDAVNGEYGAPIYQVMNTFSCMAPVRVRERFDPVGDVITTVTTTP